MRPSVYIIGAGPGAPDLISVRGLRALQACDVVIYDNRIQPRLLDAAPAGAERIDVGSAAPQAAEQDAINFLIAEKAREGHVVARLKWGDPFVFDRGGAEALFLHEQGVAFEVIPGVPALVAAPAFAGIPLTYPGGGDTVVFLRGFEDEGRKPPTVDGRAWRAWMAPSSASPVRDRWRTCRVTAGARACGSRDRRTGAARHDLGATDHHGAVVRDRARVQEREVTAPGVLVIGAVVGLRDHLRWFDKRPLFGRRVLVTRSREQAPELVELLELNGAEAIEAPVLRIGPPADPGPLERAAASARSFDWIVFTSTNAVASFVSRVVAGAQDLRALAGPRICAVGPGTSSRLHKYGISPDLEPGDHRSGGVVTAMADASPLKGARVLLPTSDLTGDSLAEDLVAAGAEVTEVTAYRATTVEGDRHLGLYRELLDHRIDAVTFTSANTVRAFVEIYGAEQSPDLLSGTVVATIGPAATDAAARAGIHVHVAAEGATVAALVDDLIRHFREQPS